MKSSDSRELPCVRQRNSCWTGIRKGTTWLGSTGCSWKTLTHRKSPRATGWDILVAPYLRLLQIPVTATFGLLSIFVCFSIAYDLGKQWKLEAVVSGSMALLVFLMVQIDINSKDLPLAMNGLDSKGVFVAILIAMITVRVQKFFNDRNFVIKLPENVPPVVYESFLSLMPLLFLVTVFWLIRFVAGVDINGVIQWALKPLIVGLDTLPGILFYAFLVTVLWSVGINGDNTVDAIVAPVFLQFFGTNIDAIKLGQPLPYVTAAGLLYHVCECGRHGGDDCPGAGLVELQGARLPQGQPHGDAHAGLSD